MDKMFVGRAATILQLAKEKNARSDSNASTATSSVKSNVTAAQALPSVSVSSPRRLVILQRHKAFTLQPRRLNPPVPVPTSSTCSALTSTSNDTLTAETAPIAPYSKSFSLTD